MRQRFPLILVFILAVSCENTTLRSEEFRGFWEGEQGLYSVRITDGSANNTLNIETDGFPNGWNRQFTFIATIDGRTFETNVLPDSSTYLIDLNWQKLKITGELSEDGQSIFAKEHITNNPNGSSPNQKTQDVIWNKQ